jgi:hypothetical protein
MVTVTQNSYANANIVIDTGRKITTELPTESSHTGRDYI